MARCKECNKPNNKYGILELKKGVCWQCQNKKTPECKGCGENFSPEQLSEGLCQPCHEKEIARRSAEQERQ